MFYVFLNNFFSKGQSILPSHGLLPVNSQSTMLRYTHMHTHTNMQAHTL